MIDFSSMADEDKLLEDEGYMLETADLEIDEDEEAALLAAEDPDCFGSNSTARTFMVGVENRHKSVDLELNEELDFEPDFARPGSASDPDEEEEDKKSISEETHHRDRFISERSANLAVGIASSSKPIPDNLDTIPIKSDINLNIKRGFFRGGFNRGQGPPIFQHARGSPNNRRFMRGVNYMNRGGFIRGGRHQFNTEQNWNQIPPFSNCHPNVIPVKTNSELDFSKDTFTSGFSDATAPHSQHNTVHVNPNFQQPQFGPYGGGVGNSVGVEQPVTFNQCVQFENQQLQFVNHQSQEFVQQPHIPVQIQQGYPQHPATYEPQPMIQPNYQPYVQAHQPFQQVPGFQQQMYIHMPHEQQLGNFQQNMGSTNAPHVRPGHINPQQPSMNIRPAVQSFHNTFVNPQLHQPRGSEFQRNIAPHFQPPQIGPQQQMEPHRMPYQQHEMRNFGPHQFNQGHRFPQGHMMQRPQQHLSSNAHIRPSVSAQSRSVVMASQHQMVVQGSNSAIKRKIPVLESAGQKIPRLQPNTAKLAQQRLSQSLLKKAKANQMQRQTNTLLSAQNRTVVAHSAPATLVTRKMRFIGDNSNAKEIEEPPALLVSNTEPAAVKQHLESYIEEDINTQHLRHQIELQAQKREEILKLKKLRRMKVAVKSSTIMNTPLIAASPFSAGPVKVEPDQQRFVPALKKNLAKIPISSVRPLVRQADESAQASVKTQPITVRQRITAPGSQPAAEIKIVSSGSEPLKRTVIKTTAQPGLSSNRVVLTPSPTIGGGNPIKRIVVRGSAPFSGARFPKLTSQIRAIGPASGSGMRPSRLPLSPSVTRPAMKPKFEGPLEAHFNAVSICNLNRNKTTTTHLKNMASSFGVVTNISMNPEFGSAMIHFQNASSTVDFVNAFNGRTVDGRPWSMTYIAG